MCIVGISLLSRFYASRFRVPLKASSVVAAQHAGSCCEKFVSLVVSMVCIGWPLAHYSSPTMCLWIRSTPSRVAVCVPLSEVVVALLVLGLLLAMAQSIAILCNFKQKSFILWLVCLCWCVVVSIAASFCTLECAYFFFFTTSLPFSDFYGNQTDQRVNTPKSQHPSRKQIEGWSLIPLVR